MARVVGVHGWRQRRCVEGVPGDATESGLTLLDERDLATLGKVNPLALEEFAALEQRHQFLTEQLTDLSNRALATARGLNFPYV